MGCAEIQKKMEILSALEFKRYNFEVQGCPTIERLVSDFLGSELSCWGVGSWREEIRGKIVKDKWKFAIGTAAVLLIAFFLIGGLPSVPQSTVGLPGFGSQQAQTILAVKDANIRITAVNKYGGDTPNINAELITSSGATVVGETAISARGASLTTAGPTSFDGFVIMGNDNFQSTTDRGAEIYYNKEAVSWSVQSNIELGPYEVVNESTPTHTGYDDGTAEATTNITVGSGQSITSTELKIAAGDNACLGNPDFARPLAVAFNASAINDWDEIRPAVYEGNPFTVPGFLSGLDIVGGKAYLLPTGAICDYGEYRYYVIHDAKSGVNPAAGSTTYANYLDRTYTKNDKVLWTDGWGDDSDLVADTDIGFANVGNEKLIAVE